MQRISTIAKPVTRPTMSAESSAIRFGRYVRLQSLLLDPSPLCQSDIDYIHGYIVSDDPTVRQAIQSKLDLEPSFFQNVRQALQFLLAAWNEIEEEKRAYESGYLPAGRVSQEALLYCLEIIPKTASVGIGIHQTNPQNRPTQTPQTFVRPLEATKADYSSEKLALTHSPTASEDSGHSCHGDSENDREYEPPEDIIQQDEPVALGVAQIITLKQGRVQAEISGKSGGADEPKRRKSSKE